MTTCPTCGHAHPSGIGARMCGCKDCLLLWGGIPRDLLAPAFAARLAELEAAYYKDDPELVLTPPAHLPD